jgi:hypothetical protein
MSEQLNKFLEVARGEEGFIEGPADNQTHYQKANQPWCGAFVNFCAKKAKVTSIPNCTFTPSGAEAFQVKGKWQDAESATPMTYLRAGAAAVVALYLANPNQPLKNYLFAGVAAVAGPVMKALDPKATEFGKGSK